ncbi:MAG TPA: CAP domain-containing protein [Candidatus Dormibacteraeota bacterium]|nr:CAP domain-containing protein [Candidatus Dormibacteraeota bacterium]
MITGVPLVAIASLTILGSQSRHQPALKPLKPASVAFHRPQRPAAIRFRLSATPAPTPTPAPPPPPAPVAARPAPPPPAPPRPPTPPVSPVGGAAGVEFSLVNQDRAGNGAAALAWSGSLGRVAQYRAQDMLNRNYFSHYDPATGQLAFVQLLHLWGIPYSTAGENIAWSTNPSMAAINTMFMNSPEHRANILNGAYHRMGVGVASNGAKTMVVEVFSN